LDGKLSPEEAVHAYHGVLQGKGIRPHRALEEDLKLTDQSMSYDGSAARRATAEVRNNPLAQGTSARSANRDEQSRVTSTATNGDWPRLANGKPDFDRMTAQERAAYHAARLNRAL